MVILSEQEVRDYINILENPIHKKVFLEALEYGNCIFKEKEYNIPRSVSIIVPVPEFKNITEKDYFGIYISLFPNDIGTWVADSRYSDVFSTGEYSYDESLKTIIDKSIKNAGTCNFCKKHVGLQNLSRVAFSDKSCKDCLASAKEQLEFKGWYN